MSDIELQTFKSYENTIPIPKSYIVQVNDKVKFINPNDFDINELNIQNKNMLVKNRIFYINYNKNGYVGLSSEATPETTIEIPIALLYDMFSLANNSSSGGRKRRTNRRRRTTRRRRTIRRRR